MKAKIEKSVTKLEFLLSVIAHSDKGSLDMEGMYFVFNGIIEEIKEALDDVQDRPAYTAMNKIAS